MHLVYVTHAQTTGTHTDHCVTTALFVRLFIFGHLFVLLRMFTRMKQARQAQNLLVDNQLKE